MRTPAMDPAETRRAALEADLRAWASQIDDDEDPAPAQDSLLALRERHADVFLAAGDADWPGVYVAAEAARRRCSSVGCGTEGLVLMAAVYQIRAAHARRYELLGGRANLKAALAIWRTIADDPYQVGRFADAEVRRLRWIAAGVPARLLSWILPWRWAPVLFLIGFVVATGVFGPLVLDDTLPVRTRSMAAFFPIVALVVAVEALWRRGGIRSQR